MCYARVCICCRTTADIPVSMLNLSTDPPTAPPEVTAAPEDGIADVTQLEDDICQLLADALHLHERVENGVLVVKIQQKRFSFAQLTFDRKPQVKYELAS
jgi:hypothetical protein